MIFLVVFSRDLINDLVSGGKVNINSLIVIFKIYYYRRMNDIYVYIFIQVRLNRIAIFALISKYGKWQIPLKMHRRNIRNVRNIK